MTIYLIRHGQTNYNELGLNNADPDVDVHLSLDGIEQVNILAEKLKAVEINQIFISELRRTKQTADIINKYHDLPMCVDSRLNDISTGYEGKAAQEYFDARDAADNRWSARLNDGESLEDVIKRAKDFVDEISCLDYSSVLIVTSGEIVSAIYGLIQKLTNEEAWSRRVGNASCMKLEFPTGASEHA